MDEALELVEKAVHNHQVLYGSKGRTNKFRAVQFTESLKPDSRTESQSVEHLQRHSSLGLDFLHHFGCEVNYKKLEFKIGNQVLQCKLNGTGQDGRQHRVRVVRVPVRVVIPPESSRVIGAKVDNPNSDTGTYQ